MEICTTKENPIISIIILDIRKLYRIRWVVFRQPVNWVNYHYFSTLIYNVNVGLMVRYRGYGPMVTIQVYYYIDIYLKPRVSLTLSILEVFF